MSLAIDTAKVHEVLLPDGTWHEVAGQSFEIDAYEYHRGGSNKLDRGQEKHVPEFGAKWVERDTRGNGRAIFCPLTAIQAVAYAVAKGQK